MSEVRSTLQERLLVSAEILLEDAHLDPLLRRVVEPLIASTLKKMDEVQIRAALLEFRDTILPYLLDGGAPALEVETSEQDHDQEQ